MEGARIDGTAARGAALLRGRGSARAFGSGAVPTVARAGRLSRRAPAPRWTPWPRWTGWTRRPAAAALLALVGLVGLATGCGREPTDEAADGLAPESFIEVMVALREAEREAVGGDSAAVEFERRKEEILAEHAVSEEDLRGFVRMHHQDFTLMNRVWDSIAQRLRYLPDEPVRGQDFRIDRPR